MVIYEENALRWEYSDIWDRQTDIQVSCQSIYKWTDYLVKLVYQGTLVNLLLISKLPDAFIWSLSYNVWLTTLILLYIQYFDSRTTNKQKAGRQAGKLEETNVHTNSMVWNLFILIVVRTGNQNTVAGIQRSLGLLSKIRDARFSRWFRSYGKYSNKFPLAERSTRLFRPVILLGSDVSLLWSTDKTMRLWHWVIVVGKQDIWLFMIWNDFNCLRQPISFGRLVNSLWLTHNLFKLRSCPIAAGRLPSLLLLTSKSHRLSNLPISQPSNYQVVKLPRNSNASIIQLNL
jgi:hypothetical protein